MSTQMPWPGLRRLCAREWMDDEDHTASRGEWRANLRDLALINATLGGWFALRCEVARLPAIPRSILDVGTGGADMAVWLVGHLARRRAQVRCVAVDRSALILDLARDRCAGQSAIAFLQADARCLPFADQSFDLATMNLTLHHFEPDEARRVLAELGRVASSVIVTDLRRSYSAWLGARLVLPLLTANRCTRHDGPISVLRAYTPREAVELAHAAGWRRVAVRRYPGFRMALAGGMKP
jgi:2-polyprenyl-3-methyl-5-hydroxy-6-metoxy-1,4-benzoquinol methylase